MSLHRRLIVLVQSLAISVVFSLSLVPALTLTASAAAPKASSVCAAHDFFGLKPWFGYLHEYRDSQNECAVCFNVSNTANFDTKDCPNSDSSSFPLIGLAVVDDLLRISGLVAVGYVFYGAIQYITSQGSPDATSKAQGTIINALIGAGVASIAVVLVSFLGSKLGG